MENLTVEKLIKALTKMPSEAEIFISGLCMGRITEAQIEYDKEFNRVQFKQKFKSKEFDIKYK